MSNRAKHESQIKSLSPNGGVTFENAVAAVVFSGGLDWFTDAQLEEIRDHMIQAEWSRRVRMAKSRASFRTNRKAA